MLDIKKIDKQYYYEGNDLGCTYTKDYTTFRVWAPTAEQVNLNLYKEDLLCASHLVGSLQKGDTVLLQRISEEKYVIVERVVCFA